MNNLQLIPFKPYPTFILVYLNVKKIFWLAWTGTDAKQAVQIPSNREIIFRGLRRKS